MARVARCEGYRLSSPIPQVKIPPAAVANSLVFTKVDVDLASSAEQSTAQGPCRAAHLHASGVAAGHKPLAMDLAVTAVQTSVPTGREPP